MPGGTTINTAGRMHVQADETVYLQPWGGTVVVGGGGGPGAVDAQDVYIRAAGKWASQFMDGMVMRDSNLYPLWSCPAGTSWRGEFSATGLAIATPQDNYWRWTGSSGQVWFCG